MSVSVSCLHQYVVFVDGGGPFRCPEICIFSCLNIINFIPAADDINRLILHTIRHACLKQCISFLEMERYTHQLLVRVNCMCCAARVNLQIGCQLELSLAQQSLSLSLFFFLSLHDILLLTDSQ